MIPKKRKKAVSIMAGCDRGPQGHKDDTRQILLCLKCITNAVCTSVMISMHQYLVIFLVCAVGIVVKGTLSVVSVESICVLYGTVQVLITCSDC